MKFSVGWLKTFIDVSISTQDLLDALVNLGLEVEDCVDQSTTLRQVVFGVVVECNPHPDSNKLQVCQVDIGGLSHSQVVCGAANARKGLVVAMAKPGTYIPSSQMTIKETVIRGVASKGMLCSYEELGFTVPNEVDGIIEFPQSYANYKGKTLEEILGDEFIWLDTKVTPNRPDWLGVIGVARELSALKGSFKKELIDHGFVQVSYDSSVNEAELKNYMTINTTPIAKIANAEHGCQFFTTRFIQTNVNQEVPFLLKLRLASAGQKSVNIVVDITNYMNLSYNQPMHAYDAKTIQESIIVRRAKEEEVIEALNGKSYILNNQDIVISDTQKVLAIAGIIGGENSSVNHQTTQLCLEVAYFTPDHVMNTGRRLNLQTDSRYRFERGIDKTQVVEMNILASLMLAKLTEAKVSPIQIIDCIKDKQKKIWDFNFSESQKLLGRPIENSVQLDILVKLGYQIISQKLDSVSLVAPSYRVNIENVTTIASDIVRVLGVNHITKESLTPLTRQAMNNELLFNSTIKHYCASKGLLEAQTYSFLDLRYAERFNWNNIELLSIHNPISQELAYMRPSLLPNLIKLSESSIARGSKNIAIFEVGSCYQGFSASDEKNHLGFLFSGCKQEESWEKKPESYSIFDAKRLMMQLFRLLNIKTDSIFFDSSSLPNFIHSGQGTWLKLGSKNVIGYIGKVHPLTANLLNLSQDYYVGELFLSNLPLSTSHKQKEDISLYQKTTRDFAFIVKNEQPADSMIRAIKNIHKQYIKQVDVFDVFKGGNLPIDMKSIAFRVTLQSSTETLTEAIIQSISDSIIQQLTHHFNAQLRDS